MTVPYLVFAGLGIIWGSNFLFMKMAVAMLEPMQVVCLRVICGSVPILAYALARGELKFGHWKRAHHFIIMSLLANVLPFFFFVKGTQSLASGIAGVISGTIPLMTFLLTILLLPGEKPDYRRLAGVALGLAGVALVADTSGAAVAGGSARGAVFVLLGSASYALAMVYARKFLTPLKMGAVPLAAYQTMAAAVMLFLATPLNGASEIFHAPAVLWSLVLGLGLAGTGVAFVMYYFLIERLGAVTASSVYYIPPLVALFAGAVFMNESVSRGQGLGTALILAGIYLARNGAIYENKKREDQRAVRPGTVCLHES